jgi:protease I
MSLTGKKIVLLTAPYFEESEVIFPLYRLREEGAEVILSGVGEKGNLMKGKSGTKLTIAEPVTSLNFDTVHAVVIPGGFAPDSLRSNERVQALVHHVHSRGGVVAAICHGPWVLVSAELIRGHQCTSYISIKDDMVNAGGLWEDAPVVVSNRIITSRCPDDLPAFCKAIISQVSKLNF